MLQRVMSEIANEVNLNQDEIKKIESILSKYEIIPIQTQIVKVNTSLLQLASLFIVAKRIAGLSENTLTIYTLILKDFIKSLSKDDFNDVTPNDIRLYLYRYQQTHSITNRTLDMRRIVIMSFFEWLNQEEYISRNPAKKVDKIKYEKLHKRAMTQMDLEKIRNNCKNPKALAIVDMLYSTGCRVSELSNLDIKDVNFETKEVRLFGKGAKHRMSFLNAKAEVSLKNYLSTRIDDNPALFVSSHKPYDRMQKAGIEKIIRDLTSGLDLTTNVTPHIFRHTTATIALNRGMSVVDVSKLLGHTKVETTMEYITSSNDLIKSKHQACVV